MLNHFIKKVILQIAQTNSYFNPQCHIQDFGKDFSSPNQRIFEANQISTDQCGFRQGAMLLLLLDLGKVELRVP